MPSTSSLQIVAQSNVSFSKDVKIDENRYKSYKYIPIVSDIYCNDLFGTKNYTDVVIKINNTMYCRGFENGFSPDLKLEMFKTYEVEFDSRRRNEIYIQFEHEYLLCSDTCPFYSDNSLCEDGGPDSHNFSMQLWYRLFRLRIQVL